MSRSPLGFTWKERDASKKEMAEIRMRAARAGVAVGWHQWQYLWPPLAPTTKRAVAYMAERRSMGPSTERRVRSNYIAIILCSKHMKTWIAFRSNGPSKFKNKYYKNTFVDTCMANVHISYWGQYMPVLLIAWTRDEKPVRNRQNTVREEWVDAYRVMI